MRIKQISIDGLFGIFNHVVPLNRDERITIVHSPNGFGKTIMLRMLSGFFNSQYSIFRTIAFDRFRVDFDNNKRIEVVKEIDNIKFDFYGVSFKETFSLGTTVNPSNLDFSSDALEALIPGIRRVGSEAWRHLATGEILSLAEVFDRFEDFLPAKMKLQDEPAWLAYLKNEIHVRLIESQRLLNVFSDPALARYPVVPSMIPAVSAYSEEIAQLIQSKLAEYGALSQSLDRTFPSRVVQQSHHHFTDEQLRHKLDDFEEARARFMEIGLLDKDENSDFQIQSQSIDESTKNVLSVYVEDVEKKFVVFSKIANKIHLLRRIINSKFAYSYKQMNFSKEKGFVFKTLYQKASGDTLSPIDLSSGEQHELVLLYELLFKVEPNSLVLIDEPELSLHVGWQAQFLKDLQEIMKLADLDILMATHSPDIIQDRWDLTVELKGPVQ
jgi:predicted ATP-binding protein involved in virulence